MDRNVTILVGTTKGVFLIVPQDSNWSVRGPFCDGWSINHVVGDPVNGTIWAAGGGEWSGAGVWRSTDGGSTWTVSRLSTGKFDEWLAADPDFAAHIGRTPAPPAPFTGEIENLWSLGLSGSTLYAGAKPATLFASKDGGETWEKVRSLTDHPSRESWQPGAAGLILHSIVADPGEPKKLWVGISAAGVFATEDGGQSWDRRNRRSNEDGAQDHDHGHGHAGHEVGHCVHNFARSAAAPDGTDLLYQQNHHGVFVSRDGGRSWADVSAGLPSTFGFPIAVHPTDPETAWVLPLNGDMLGRFPPGASAAVWRTRDGGQSWTRQGSGLPQEACYFTVLRQAMASDRCTPAGVYFGTNSGSIFMSADEGDHWEEIARHLPTILSVETLERA